MYDESVSLIGWTARNILDIVLRNTYSTASRSNVEGNALHYIFNHSCMPNTDRIEFGDMRFIRTSVVIPAGSELVDEIRGYVSEVFAEAMPVSSLVTGEDGNVVSPVPVGEPVVGTE